MGQTMIEKILSRHADRPLKANDIADIRIDARAARDFGGANVVKNIQSSGLGVADPSRTIFTFDCYPGATDAKYATNQQVCRVFAEEYGVRVSDVEQGIGTHIAIDEGLVVPGETFVSTDSHANILGAIGAFGQGMGDQDIAHAWAYGTTWFKVPHSVRVILKGMPSHQATPKDVSLALLRHFGANGLLGLAAELSGPYIGRLPLAGRITIASQATEMGAIIALIAPNQEVLDYCSRKRGRKIEAVLADPDATYLETIEVDITNLTPMISRPGHPEDVVPVAEVAGRRMHSGFIGSCTNGRFEDLAAAAALLKGRKVASGVVLKIVPSTDEVWRRCLSEGIFTIFKDAGAMVSNPGCAGCAAGQVGQNGPGEVTVSTGNRNYAGKQGKGDVYLASPEVVAASAIAGRICTPATLGQMLASQPPVTPKPPAATARTAAGAAGAGTDSGGAGSGGTGCRPTVIEGRVWVIRIDNIDTDMIFHNRYLAITNLAEMGQYTFDNLKGWEDFAKKAQTGDIVVVGKNFGAGSSRQQAVDCFKALGVSLLIAQSFGAIYERNAINAGLPILNADLVTTDIRDGERIRVDLATGTITRLAGGQKTQGQPFPTAQMTIYQRGGLLVSS
jgi:3-isopropylmalate/(R)-2-methylmalate dehydratase large subunit